jgi:hypothetical protein
MSPSFFQPLLMACSKHAALSRQLAKVMDVGPKS